MADKLLEVKGVSKIFRVGGMPVSYTHLISSPYSDTISLYETWE